MPHQHRQSGFRGRIFALSILAAGAFPAMAAADVAPAPPAERILYKTATYQGLSSLNDFLFGLMVIGRAGAGGVLAAASTVTEPVTYYAHERVWGGVQAIGGYGDIDLMPVKTTTYTVVNMGRIFVTGALVTGSASLAAGYVAFNAVADAITYVGNDVMWHMLWPVSGPSSDKDLIEDF